jgi:hypothetical protein
MSKLEIPSKIRAENFKEEDRDVASKIGAIYNLFADELYSLLNKGLGYDNLNRQIVTINVVIDASSKIVNPPAVKLNLIGGVKGIVCIGAICTSNNLLYPTSTPFISGTVNNNTLIIQNVTGLQANSQYSLTLELIGA